MVQVTLTDVTDDNKDACLALSVAEDQAAYIPDVSSSLEMAELFPDARPLAIANQGGQVVGFAMVGVDQETGHWKIFRLMIDYEHQGKGIGAAATQEIIRILVAKGAATILICYQDSNDVARALYARFGFAEYGKDGTKVLARLVVR